jgi:hypothetical protein
MNPAPLLSIVSGALCLMLSFVFLVKNGQVQSRSEELQKQQTEFQSQQQTLQTEQQKFQNQQQQINSASQLASQVGPQVLNDLGLAARDNKNDKIKKLLEKYGVTINDKAVSSPAPSSAPKPAEAPKLQ